MDRRTILYCGTIGVGALATTLFIGWWQVDGPGAPNSQIQRPLSLSEMEFRLIDHEGSAVGPELLLGSPTMVFFGFTFCPDVCPTVLSRITGWLDGIGEEAADMNVIFITVDPERDTFETIAEYIDFFHPLIRGWTGTQDEIAKAAYSFRASYERVPVEDGNYAINHTASVYLFDATGRFVTMIDYHEPREIAAQKIRRAFEE